jgi:geranylgeranyl pyrophosphate synthase
LTDEQSAAIQQVLVDSGAVRAVEDSIVKLRDESINAISSSKLSIEAIRALIELAHFVTDRSY